ncbi:hypothetical protein PVAP13_5KG304900 [Panicum virgatum]|uniref:Uncharacterized protein n=1 Tax=Panicum virgatum TaxID=38727 RepID=A0A8T0SNH9_PANVG|nr:hypothetical protein PVAP13_5KG304900 [Panicum virgatum]
MKLMTNDHFGRSPFDMKLIHPQPPRKDAEACFKWLVACSSADDQLNWAWVVHEEPTSIRVAGARMKPQMICGGELKADVCNLVTRLYSQLDDQVYVNNGTRDPRWRHFLPADWALLALQHGSNICKSSPAVVSMFSGSHITYDVELCRMVIAPVELEGAWSCYVWDFMEKKLSILDPLLSRYGGNEPVIRIKHSRAAPLLLDALLACRSQYCNSRGYGDQELNLNSWATKILGNFGGTRTFHKHNTGMYTLFYAREFDGKDLHQKAENDPIPSPRPAISAPHHAWQHWPPYH